MAKEIERKFLVSEQSYRSLAKPIPIRQGFLYNMPEMVARVRIIGDGAFLAIKGQDTGITRDEFEYPIPIADALHMLEHLCIKPLIEKIRYRVMHEGNAWDVDEFLEENAGLVVAEIELKDEGQAFKKPPWIGREVTGDPRYYNASLVRHPFREWKR